MENTQLQSAAALQQATKDLIISLRIQLGQGTTTSDFDTTYPYKPTSLLPSNTVSP
jgi:hypothetical protein